MKENVEVENQKLKDEINDMKQKMIENEKKKNKYKSQIQELQTINEKFMKDNKALKEEIGELIMGKK